MMADGLRTDCPPHLASHMAAFMRDHPDRDRNVFVMMRFVRTQSLVTIWDVIRKVLARHGFNAIRADERDYSDELWTNVELCMTGSRFGIAVLEDIDQRDVDANVCLELGYMVATGRRCLILKERRGPLMPALLAHRLHKQFDALDIECSVVPHLERWIAIDLPLTT